MCIGGAYSVDKKQRIIAKKYWRPDEQPSSEIKRHVIRKLDSINWKVDIVFSHTCPERYIPIEVFLDNVKQEKVDRSTEEWLGYIENRLEYNNWYCGHWHINKRIDKLYFLYDGVVDLYVVN